jgi:D-amino-acid dehydrogenase
LTGFEVTVVDSGKVGRGCSFANAGLIVASHNVPLPGPGVVREGLGYLGRRDGPFYIRPRPDAGLARWIRIFLAACGADRQRRGAGALVDLSRSSLELVEDLVRTGHARFLYERGPLLSVYLSEDWEPAAAEEAEEQADAGFTARVLGRDELLGIEPGVGPSVRGAVLVEDQAWGDCYGYVRSLADGLEEGGSTMLEGRHVERVLVENGAVDGVAAGADELPADVVVLAAGASTPSLAKPLGIRLPIQPARGYSSTFRSWEGAPRIPLMVEEAHVVVTPLGDRIRFAGTLELGAAGRPPDPVRAGAVVREGRRALRDDVALGGEKTWFGYRPLTADDLPVIGRVPGVEGAILATGHGTLGFTQAAATGKVVAELASGNEPSVEIEPFRPDRF